MIQVFLSLSEQAIRFERIEELHPADLQLQFLVDEPSFPVSLSGLTFDVTITGEGESFERSFPDAGVYVSTDSAHLTTWSCSPRPMTTVDVAVTMVFAGASVTESFVIDYDGPAYEENHYWDGEQWVINEYTLTDEPEYEVE